MKSDRNNFLYLNLNLFIFLVISLKSLAQSDYPATANITSDKIESSPSSTFDVLIDFDVNESWYIYAPTGNNASQGVIETNIIFQLPQGITRKGKMQYPKSKLKAGHEIYEGKNIVFKQQFTTDKNIPSGEYIIKAKITYQSCNDKICLPPKTDEEEIKIIIGEK